MLSKRKLAEQNKIMSLKDHARDLPLPDVLKQIILDYCDKNYYDDNNQNHDKLKVNFDYQHYPYQNQLSFFGNLKSQILVAQAAHYVLRANPQAALALINQSPSLLHTVVVAEDPHGNKAKGTPLQLAMMAGDFNIREMEENERDHGLVEQLSAGLDKEVIIAQHKAVFQLGWENEMNERMRPIRAALYKFANIIQNATPADIETMLQQYKNKIIPDSVKEFRADLIPDPKKIITSGYIVDPEILAEAYHYFEKNVAHYGGWDSNKSDLYFVYGIGSLQRYTFSICDLQVLKNGLYQTIKDKAIVKRDPRLLTEDIKARLGLYFYLNIFEGEDTRCAARMQVLAERHAISMAELGVLLWSLCRAKTTAQKNLYGESNRSLTQNRII